MALAAVGWPSNVLAQAAAASNYPLFETQRRDAIARQLGVQEELRARRGLSSRVFPGLRPYSLEAIYAGLATPLGARAWGSPDVFEPWPLVPGDLYGRQFDFASPTPMGHVTTYTGPNSYVYEPYYATPIDVVPPRRPLPAPTRPWLPQGVGPAGPPLATPQAGDYPPAAEEIPLPSGEILREF